MAYYNLTFNVIGVTMAYYNLTFNVIGATMGGPSQNPLACLYKPRVCGNKAELLRRNPCCVWLSLTPRGAGVADSRLTSPRDPSALLREVPLPLSFCGAPPAAGPGRLPCPLPGDLPNQVVKPRSTVLQTDSYCLSHQMTKTKWNWRAGCLAQE